MSVKSRTQYTFEHYDRATDKEHVFNLPFNTDAEPDHIFINADGTRALLGFIVQDESPADPFTEFDEGDFYQFDRNRLHDTTRPDLEEWKQIIRSNAGRVVSVDSTGDGFRAGALLTVRDTRGAKGSNGEKCRAADILDDADGYYIAPDDVTDAEAYARGAIEQYSAFCTGDVYGVIVWKYEREAGAEEWPDPDRDAECWGFYGDDYAREELQSQFDALKAATV